MLTDRSLHVVQYHHVRNSSLDFPRLEGIRVDDFRDQIATMSAAYEIASIESAYDFLTGEYRPRRDLCLLTFDDGLKEHFTEVLPVLAEKRIRAVFFVATACLEDRRVPTVHMNRFLLASMDFESYAGAFFQRTLSMCPDAFAPLNVDPSVAAEAYPCDAPEVARFKYLFNFGMDPDLRDRAVTELFTSHISEEKPFAEALYLSWDEVRQMQKAGMAIGGHSHQHKPLAGLSSRELAWDLESCHRLLTERLAPQAVWPFSYPFGKRESFHIRAMRKLQQLGFHCAFSSESGENHRGSDLYTICRTDCKKLMTLRAGA